MNKLTMALLLISLLLMLAILISSKIHRASVREAYDLFEERERLRHIEALRNGHGFIRNPNPWSFARHYPPGVLIRVRGVGRFAKIKNLTLLTIFGWDAYKRVGGVRKLLGVVWGYS